MSIHLMIVLGAGIAAGFGYFRAAPQEATQESIENRPANSADANADTST